MCTSSSSQLSSGFDWSEEGKAQNNKRQREDDDESSDSETEVSEQVMYACTGELRFDRACNEVMCYLS